MNAYHRLPQSPNIYTADDVIHFVAAELNITPEEARQRIIHINRLRKEAIAQHGKVIARSSLGAIHSYSMADETKVQDGNSFVSGMVVVTFSMRSTGRTSRTKPAKNVRLLTLFK